MDILQPVKINRLTKQTQCRSYTEEEVHYLNYNYFTEMFGIPRAVIIIKVLITFTTLRHNKSKEMKMPLSEPGANVFKSSWQYRRHNFRKYPFDIALSNPALYGHSRVPLHSPLRTLVFSSSPTPFPETSLLVEDVLHPAKNNSTHLVCV